MEEIKEGYKKTKVGIVPSDWKVVKLGDIFDFHQTNSFSRNLLNYNSGEVKNIHYGDIHTKFKINFNILNENVPFINNDIDLKNIKEENYCQIGDLIVADASEDYKDIGKSIEIINLNNQKLLAGLHTHLLRSKKNTLALGFSGYLMLSYSVKLQMMKIATGISVLGISKGNLQNIKLPIPPIEEQTKIAKILSLWDKVIEKQTELIKQKKLYKKGLMQKLLSGEMRFKEFGDKWKNVKIDDVTYCLDNKRIPLNREERNKIKGNIPYYGSTSIVDYINDYIFDENLVLVSEDGGYFFDYKSKPIAFFISGKSWINNHAHILKNKKELYLKFLYYSLVHKDVTAFLNGGTRAKLNKKDLLLIKISLPTLQEQTKIANILNLVDREIELLEKELYNFKLQKRDLIQKLLSGQVRVLL